MLKISLILAEKDDTYQDIACKFFQHFTQISDAINEMSSGLGLWDQQDGFYYDHLNVGTNSEALRVRSMVGLVPLMACLVLDNEYMKTLPVFKKRVEWFMQNRKDLASQVSDPEFMKKMSLTGCFKSSIVNCILRKEFNASLGKCKLIQVGNLSK